MPDCSGGMYGFKRALTRQRSTLAYAFYATNDAYALAVLVAARLLRKAGVRSDTDFVVLHLNVSVELREAMEKAGMITIECEPLRFVYDSFYTDCLTKLRILQLVQYDRVIYLDADTILLKSLDHLFELPDDCVIAAPRAYWLEQPWVTSFLIVVNPTPDLWPRVIPYFEQAREKRHYDMEIINIEFRSELKFLSDEYGCINKEWESRDADFHFGDPEQSVDRIPIVHFSSVVKPWQSTTDNIREQYPSAHRVFFNLWSHWRGELKEISTQLSIDTVV